MINVIGLGYIGLPTALILAANGKEVIGTDYNDKVVDKLKNGEITFKEEGLKELYDTARNKGILFSKEYKKADQYIIAVPTPYIKKSKKIDPVYIIRAVRSVLDICPKKAIIIIESTISPGTVDEYIRPLIEEAGFVLGEDLFLAHAPERIIPGNMIYELRHNARTIGVEEEETAEILKDIYGSFCKGELIITDIKTAEMTKVVENTYRDINIAFANELAKICHSAKLDVYEIIKIANKHPRVNILNPGPGVGGHCISVDPWFLVGDYPGLVNVILSARETNDTMPEYVLLRMHEIMEKENIKSVSRVGLYGLTYKENVDDIRESPTLQLLDCMKEHLASGIKVYDPFLKENIVENQYFDFDEFLSQVDFVVIMVGHNELKQNIAKLKDKILLDTRNLQEITYTHYLI